MVDLGLAATALLLGAAGGPHCAVMCGPAQGAVVRACGASSRGGLGALHAGRAVGYAIAGALLAGGVSALGEARDAQTVLAPVWRLLHVAAVGFGLWLVVTGEQPRWLAERRFGALAATGGSSGWQAVAWPPPTAAAGGPGVARGSAGRWRAGVAGLAWAGLPCGLLQSALLTSALASGAAAGAGVMAVFAGASATSMAVAQVLWGRLGGAPPGAGRSRGWVRVAGGLLVGASGWALVHDIGRATGAAWCA